MNYQSNYLISDTESEIDSIFNEKYLKNAEDSMVGGKLEKFDDELNKKEDFLEKMLKILNKNDTKMIYTYTLKKKNFRGKESKKPKNIKVVIKPPDFFKFLDKDIFKIKESEESGETPNEFTDKNLNSLLGKIQIKTNEIEEELITKIGDITYKVKYKPANLYGDDTLTINLENKEISSYISESRCTKLSDLQHTDKEGKCVAEDVLSVSKRQTEKKEREETEKIEKLADDLYNILSKDENDIFSDENKKKFKEVKLEDKIKEKIKSLNNDNKIIKDGEQVELQNLLKELIKISILNFLKTKTEKKKRIINKLADSASATDLIDVLRNDLIVDDFFEMSENDTDADAESPISDFFDPNNKESDSAKIINTFYKIFILLKIFNIKDTDFFKKYQDQDNNEIKYDIIKKLKEENISPTITKDEAKFIKKIKDDNNKFYKDIKFLVENGHEQDILKKIGIEEEEKKSFILIGLDDKKDFETKTNFIKTYYDNINNRSIAEIIETIKTQVNLKNLKSNDVEKVLESAEYFVENSQETEAVDIALRNLINKYENLEDVPQKLKEIIEKYDKKLLKKVEGTEEENPGAAGAEGEGATSENPGAAEAPPAAGLVGDATAASTNQGEEPANRKYRKQPSILNLGLKNFI